MLGQSKMCSYVFDDYWEDIGTVKAFFDSNIRLTDPVPPFNFFDEDARIFTRARFLPASKITSGTVASARLPQATTTAKGAIEIFSATAQSVAANAVTTAAGKTYGIQLNSAGQAVVNVPWSNTQTPVRDITVDGTALDSGEALDLISGDNITLTESGGDVTIAAARRPIKRSAQDPASEPDKL